MCHASLLQAAFEHACQLPRSKAAPTLQRLLHALLGSGQQSPLTLEALTASLEAVVPPAAGGSFLRDVAGGDAACELLRQRAAAAAVRLRDLICGASLVTLAPGEHFDQSSSLLVLSGALRLRSSNGSQGDPAPSPAKLSKRVSFLRRGQQQQQQPQLGSDKPDGSSSGVMKQFRAPAILAWAPELLESMEDRWVGADAMELVRAKRVRSCKQRHAILLLFLPAHPISPQQVRGQAAPLHCRPCWCAAAGHAWPGRRAGGSSSSSST
jgi:hypothetical protein